MTKHYGKSIFPAVAIGKIKVIENLPHQAIETHAENSEEQWQLLLEAKAETDRQLEELFEKTSKELGEELANIIDVQRLMLSDGDLNDSLEEMIKIDSLSAAEATKRAGKEFSEFFASLDDPYMKARSADVLDVTNRLLAQLLGQGGQTTLYDSTVIVADDLMPSQTLTLDRKKIAAFALRKGSASSHTAILAKSMSIPCLVQTDIPTSLGTESDGKDAIVDGEDAVVYIEPDEAVLSEMQKKIKRLEKERAGLEKMRGLETITKSGKKISLNANIGGVGDLPAVLSNDAEGIGLFRSEFLYLDRNNYPSEDELFEAYRKVTEAMDGKQVIIRTLDIGADKKADYLNLDDEENPALGLRGIRVCIENEAVFNTQLRAIYRASAYGNVAIMFPMITSVWEVKHCKEQAAKIKEQLKNEGVKTGEPELGIMIETPAAVMISKDLAKEVAFFSVGTNDLTQYTLAIDRQNSKIDRFYDPHHPAVLEMLRLIAKSAIENGIWAGICGELGADPKLTKSFIEMGYTELSVSPGYILGLRELIREMA
ncbi:MAG: phosphoenolpyruvate--protein phosphotransferase [Oscillospiraceae bacterium]|nr:phosphoenolpyruvate--protein phosphotransferase [Oscillospiraceae bacterium]MCL2279797.1 phosphoenolpyruvate--protein phosphotransferase [Oscillospiraceae bacterium]